MKLVPGMVVTHKNGVPRKGILKEKGFSHGREFWIMDIHYPDGKVYKDGSWFTHNIVPPSDMKNNKEASMLLDKEW